MVVVVVVVVVVAVVAVVVADHYYYYYLIILLLQEELKAARIVTPTADELQIAAPGLSLAADAVFTQGYTFFGAPSSPGFGLDPEFESAVLATKTKVSIPYLLLLTTCYLLLVTYYLLLATCYLLS